MILVKNVTIIDESSKWHEKQVDILINKGKIESIAKLIKSDKAEIIKGKNLHASHSWIDIGAQLNDPGKEHRESLEQLCKLAKIGGYGTIVPFPNSRPVVDSKSSIQYIQNKGKANNVNILPMASLSKGANGQDLSEMIDLYHSGAVAFSEGKKGVQDSGLLLRGLQYAQSFNGLIINTPYDNQIGHEGQIHEGLVSTSLGMRGIPAMSEHTALAQQLSFIDYAKGRMCLYGISSKESVQLIKQYNKKENKVETIVPYLNLIFTDEDLVDFDTNLKVFPPLRSIDDKKALLKGLSEGTITAISSNHNPLDPESKDLEFEYAEFGASGIETVFAGINTHSSLSTSTVIKAMTSGPARILGLDLMPISIHSKVNLTIFDTEEEWEYIPNLSQAQNNPFTGKTLRGRVICLLR